MRLTNYGMLTNREEPNKNELALEYIRNMEKHVLGDDDMLDLLAFLTSTSVLEPDVLLRSHKGLEALLQQAFTRGFFGIG